MLTHSNVNAINKCHCSSGKPTMLFGGEKNMIHDDEGGPEWPEEEVRLDKWRSERGQKVI